jgi:hypothetical protein
MNDGEQLLEILPAMRRYMYHGMNPGEALVATLPANAQSTERQALRFHLRA